MTISGTKTKAGKWIKIILVVVVIGFLIFGINRACSNCLGDMIGRGDSGGGGSSRESSDSGGMGMAIPILIIGVIIILVVRHKRKKKKEKETAAQMGAGTSTATTTKGKAKKKSTTKKVIKKKVDKERTANRKEIEKLIEAAEEKAKSSDKKRKEKDRNGALIDFDAAVTKLRQANTIRITLSEKDQDEFKLKIKEVMNLLKKAKKDFRKEFPARTVTEITQEADSCLNIMKYGRNRLKTNLELFDNPLVSQQMDKQKVQKETEELLKEVKENMKILEVLKIKEKKEQGREIVKQVKQCAEELKKKIELG